MQVCKPEILVHKSKPGCKVSVILLDWNVRESFHSLDYLNQQTADRDNYELIWLEFYNHQPKALHEKVFADPENPLIDKWLVAGYPDEYIFNKHRLYNLGIVLAEGEICVICDSDAMFTPKFIERIIEEFTHTPNLILHLDEVRNVNRDLYPFCYPGMDVVLGDGCVNWHGTTTRGLDNSPDMLHDANYGACMAARRSDLLAIGGADEHIDYLGYICGPYELTFRLRNAGRTERWLDDEYIYHTWHPNQNGINNDYQGPHDGKAMSLRSFDALYTERIQTYVENPWIAQVKQGNEISADTLIRYLSEKEEPNWHVDEAPRQWDDVYRVAPDYEGFAVYQCKHKFYGLPVDEGRFHPQFINRYDVLVEAKSLDELYVLMDYYNSLPQSMWKRVFSIPILHLPGRMLRRMKKELVRLFC